MKYAWIEDGRVRDIAPGNPTDWYHPEVATLYDTQVPDEAENGDSWTNGFLIKREIIPIQEPTIAPAPRQWTTEDFRAGMTLAEKTKWDNDSAPEIVTVKQELPQELAGATELLDFLVDAGVISQESADKILA